MIESKLTELLERTADQTTVGPPPLDALRAGAARRRHRRTALWSTASAAAVAAVIAGTTLIATQGPGDPSPPVASATPAPAPAAMRLVGLGHAAIAVPADWGKNQSSCGTAQRDTVLIDDPSAAQLCLHPRPAGVESVQLSNGRPAIDFRADETFEIDGVPAQRQRTSCVAGAGAVRICSGAVGIPSLRVWFRAESSTSAAEVDRILDRISIVKDLVGMPSYQSLQRGVEGSRKTQYAALLRQLGLKPVFETRKSPSYADDTILGVAPNPGTMLMPGTKVTITVAGG